MHMTAGAGVHFSIQHEPGPGTKNWERPTTIGEVNEVGEARGG